METRPLCVDPTFPLAATLPRMRHPTAAPAPAETSSGQIKHVVLFQHPRAKLTCSRRVGWAAATLILLLAVIIPIAVAAPTAIAGGPYSLSVGGSIILNGASSTAAPGASLVSYDWDVNGDGFFGDLTGAQPMLTSSVFSLPLGEPTIALRVTDSLGGTNTAITGLVILNAAAGALPNTHSADADENFRISLLELTRVIELYNTRNGTTRTGCYKVDATGEDGFAPDPARAPGAIVTLPFYHSADSNHDGKLSLLELTRVIELYNYRSGTTRTGQYHVQSGTEDGFAPGPAVANNPPVVNAGADQTISLPSVANLTGSASDDGLPNPPNSISLTWTMVTGPGTVVFAVPGNAATTATFSLPGSYLLRLSANDGEFTASSLTTVTVNPPLVSVPNAVGQIQSAAITAIAAAQLRLGTITTVSSSTVPPGSVISISPVPGTSVPQGSAVSWVVSTGPFDPLAQATSIYVIGRDTVYPTAGSTAGALVTTFQYSWWPGSHQIAGITTVLPVVATGENGEGVSTSTDARFDLSGRTVWGRDGEGFVTYAGYDALTGAPVSAIADTQVAQAADFTFPVPNGWVTASGGGLHLKTAIVPDAFGRPLAVTDPKGTVTYTVYKDAVREVRIYPGWDTSTSRPTGPTRVMREDLGRGYREALTMTATPSVPAGTPTGGEAIASIQSLSRDVLDTNGRVAFRDLYRDLTGVTYSQTTATLGAPGSAFERSSIVYNQRGFVIRTRDAAGTVSQSVLDTFGRTVSTLSGTDAAVFPVGATTYYDNTVSTSTGFGQVKTSDIIPSGSPGAPYTTNLLYDWRGRLAQTTAPGGVVTVVTRDNLDRVTQTDLYAGAVIGANRRGRTITLYDGRGQMWIEEVHEVHPAAGVLLDKRLTKHWYDRRGLRAKTLDGNGLFNKTRRDGAGRVIRTWTAIDSTDTTYGAALNVTGDQVASSTAVILDAAGNTVCTTAFQRKDNDTASTGDLTPVNSLISVSLNWFDKANRPTATVDYGRDNGSTRYIYNTSGSLIATGGLPTPATAAPPAPNTSDDYRVSLISYDSAGRADTLTDNLGHISKSIFNLASQRIASVDNWVDGVVTAAETTTDRRTDFTVAPGGLVTVITAHNATGTAVVDQATRYLRESPSGKSLVTSIISPDSTDTNSAGTDQVKISYDALGRTLSVTDQRGVVRTFGFDPAGRPFTDAITTVPSGVDAAVRRIERTYDGIGRRATVSSYDSAAAGNLLNQVEWTYDAWGNVIIAKQAHSAAEAGGTPPQVAYSFADGTSAGIAKYNRLIGLTYPTSSRVVRYQYGAGGSLGDAASRIGGIVEDLSGVQTTVAQYTYAGLTQVVQVGLPVAGVTCDYRGTGGDYSAYTRFWQVGSHTWKQGTPPIDGAAHTYNRAGLTTSRDYQWSHPAKWNEGVTYDGLDRMATFARGPLTGGAVPAGQAASRQIWSLDSLGNWGTWTTDADGDGAGAPVVQTRSHNKANEIDTTDSDSDASGNAIASATASGNWIDPLSDKAGNLRSGPIPGAGTTRQHYVFDAWNRLVAVKADNAGGAGAVIWSAVYDGLHRRIRTISGLVTSDSYYSEGWQELEVRVSGAATEAFTWGLRGGDDLVRRHRLGASADKATLVSDTQGSVTSLWVDGTGLVERYRYDPYGTQLITDAAGNTVRIVSAYGMRYGYTGRPVDIDTKLAYYRLRYYDVGLGRFIGRDAAGAVDGYNLYAYVRGAPWMLTDPSGLSANSDGGELSIVHQYRSGVADFFKGYGDAGVETAEGLWQLGRHPIDSAVGIATAIAHPVDTGRAIYNGVLEDVQTDRGKAKVFGGVLIGIATGGALKAARESATVAKLAGKLREVAAENVVRLPGPKVPANHAGNFTGGKYVNRQVSGDEIFYKYHGVNNRTGKTHNYLTTKRYTSESALRDDLAILDEWGIQIDRVTTFRPARGTWISEGPAASQVGKATGEFRPGGGYQGLIDTNNLPRSSVIRTDLLDW